MQRQKSSHQQKISPFLEMPLTQNEMWAIGATMGEDLTTNYTMNEFMLDYIKRTIDAGLPVLIGVNTSGQPAFRRDDKNKPWKLINDGVTAHFLVLTSYTEKDNVICSLGGFDNATKKAVEVEFNVNSKTKEMRKPPIPPNDTVALYQYKITIVRMWTSVSPGNTKTLGKHNWGSKGLE